MQPWATAFGGILAFRDQIRRIAAQPIREQDQIVVRDAFGPFFDGFDLVGRQRSTQAARFETGLLDFGDELSGRPAAIVAATTHGEPVREDKFGRVGFRNLGGQMHSPGGVGSVDY